MNELLAGAHVSIAGGMHLAFERGARLQCTAIQIFLKSSNQWKAKLLTEQDRVLFREARERSAIKAVLAHDSYLINLGSPDRDLYRKSLDAFVEEMKRANFLGVQSLILHPGAHMGAGMAAGVARVARASHALSIRLSHLFGFSWKIRQVRGAVSVTDLNTWLPFWNESGIRIAPAFAWTRVTSLRLDTTFARQRDIPKHSENLIALSVLEEYRLFTSTTAKRN